jgi:hypothetical protein
MALDENGKDGPLVKYMTKMVEWYMTEMFNGFIVNILTMFYNKLRL